MHFVNGSCHLADDNDQVARPANPRPTNTRPSRGVICSSQDRHNLWIKETKQANTLAYIDTNVPERNRPTGHSRSRTNVDLTKIYYPKFTNMVGSGHRPAEHVAARHSARCSGPTINIENVTHNWCRHQWARPHRVWGSRHWRHCIFTDES